MKNRNAFWLFIMITMVIMFVIYAVGSVFLFKAFMGMPKEDIPNWVWFFLFWRN